VAGSGWNRNQIKVLRSSSLCPRPASSLKAARQRPGGKHAPSPGGNHYRLFSAQRLGPPRPFDVRTLACPVLLIHARYLGLSRHTLLRGRPRRQLFVRSDFAFSCQNEAQITEHTNRPRSTQLENRTSDLCSSFNPLSFGPAARSSCVVSTC